MNFLHLRYFYEVARAGSFTEGARILRISQPAVSKLVHQLELDLERPLIDRDRRGIRLTEAGEVLFQSASRIFAEAERTREQLRTKKQELKGEWTLGASDTIALHLLPRLLGKFKEDHPLLRVGLFSGTSTQIKAELHADRCRLGIFFTPLRASEPFESQHLCNTEFWIVLSPRHPQFPTKARPGLADLKRAKIPRIESRHSDYGTGFPAHFHSHKLGLTSPPWLEVNQHEVKKKLVQEGFGFALLIRHTVEAEVKAGDLIRIASPQPLSAPMYAVWRRGRNIDTVSAEFLARFRKAFVKLPK